MWTATTIIAAIVASGAVLTVLIAVVLLIAKGQYADAKEIIEREIPPIGHATPQPEQDKKP